MIIRPPGWNLAVNWEKTGAADVQGCMGAVPFFRNWKAHS